MSVLGLSRKDIEQAVKVYYEEHEQELYKRFDFNNFYLYVDGDRKGYIGVEFTVSERKHEQEVFTDRLVNANTPTKGENK